MLPCMGSQTHSTGRPSRCTARTSAGRCASTLSAPKRQISVSRPGSLRGIERVDQPQQLVRLQRRAAFEADRIAHAAGVFDMRAAELARAVADPDHVAGGRVIFAAWSNRRRVIACS